MKEKLLYNHSLQVMSIEGLLGDMAHLFDLLGAKVGKLKQHFCTTILYGAHTEHSY